MENENLVQIKQNIKNKRSKIIHLSEKGILELSKIATLSLTVMSVGSFTHFNYFELQIRPSTSFICLHEIGNRLFHIYSALHNLLAAIEPLPSLINFYSSHIRFIFNHLQKQLKTVRVLLFPLPFLLVILLHPLVQPFPYLIQKVSSSGRWLSTLSIL